MSGRHRRAGTTAARGALLGTLPLVGGAGVVSGLLTGATPQAQSDPAPAEPAPVATTADAGATADRTLPGMGEQAIDAVGGARDAAAARESAGQASAVHVSTVAEQLRSQAAERAEQARASGDLELAEYHQQEADRQARAEPTSRPVVAPDPDQDLRDDETPAFDDEPGRSCTADDLLELGPLTLSGPDTGCDVDPWVADQVGHSGDRLGDRSGGDDDDGDDGDG